MKNNALLGIVISFQPENGCIINAIVVEKVPANILSLSCSWYIGKALQH
jgi:hypothetical protein